MVDALLDSDPDARHAACGKVAAALMENAGELYREPTLEKLDVLASKLP